MNLKERISEIKPNMLNCNVFSVYDYPNSYTITELLCEFFTKINECIKLCNETIDLVQWLVDEGLKLEVAKKLNQWLEDGTLASIINETLFKELNDKINGVKNYFVLLSDYKDMVNGDDWIPSINKAIEDCSKNNGVLILNDLFTVRPSNTNYIIPKSNVVISSFNKKNNGLKVGDNNTAFDKLIYGGDDKYYNFMLNGFLIDLNFENNLSGTLVSHIISGTSQQSFFIGNGENVKIKDCTFITCGVNTIATQGSTRNITIEGNTFHWKKQPQSPWYDNSVIYLDCLDYRVINNNLYCDDENGNGGIECHWGGSHAVCNYIEGFSTGVNITSPRVSLAGEGKNHICKDNIIKKCEVGVRLWTIEGTNLVNVDISDNIIEINQVSRRTNSWVMGIGVQLDHNQGKFENIKINNNIITFEKNGDIKFANPEMGGGISLRNYGSMKNVNVTNNTIKNSPVMVFNIQGYSIDRTIFENININNNIINSYGSNSSSIDDYKSAFFINFAKLINCNFENNSISDEEHGVFTYYYGDNVAFVNCKINSDNNIYNINKKGIYPYTYQGVYKGCEIKNEQPEMKLVYNYPPTNGYFRYGDIITNYKDVKMYQCFRQGRYNNVEGLIVNVVEGSNEISVNDSSKLEINDMIYLNSDLGTVKVLRINNNKIIVDRPLYKSQNDISSVVVQPDFREIQFISE